MIKLAKLLKSAVVVSIAALSLTACEEEAKDYSGVYVRQEGDFTYIKELEKTQKENNYIERFIAKRSNGTPTGDNYTRTVNIENGEIYELSGHIRAKITDTTYTQVNNGNVYTKLNVKK